MKIIIEVEPEEIDYGQGNVDEDGCYWFSVSSKENNLVTLFLYSNEFEVVECNTLES